MSPKHPVSLASLTLERLSNKFQEDYGITLDEFLKLDHKERVTIVAYVDNVNHPPENFPANTEAGRQWRYTGRKKQDKETLQQCLEIQKPAPARSAF